MDLAKILDKETTSYLEAMEEAKKAEEANAPKPGMLKSFANKVRQICNRIGEAFARAMMRFIAMVVRL